VWTGTQHVQALSEKRYKMHPRHQGNCVVYCLYCASYFCCKWHLWLMLALGTAPNILPLTHVPTTHCSGCLTPLKSNTS